MLEVRNVSKTFILSDNGEKKAITPLNNVSFSINEGEIVGLFGKSGEGKSTLAGILSGLLALDEGSVSLDGKGLYDEKKKYNRKEGKRIQLIPQKPLLALDPHQRIGKAVEEALIFAGVKRKEAKEKAFALFDEVGLERSLYTRLPYQLSGGQAQRAVIARALAVNPSVLISDESTSMLDASTQKAIIALFKKLNQERGISILFISHNERLLDSLCQRSYLLDKGNLSKKLKKGGN